MVEPAGICPGGGSGPGRRLAVASHDGAGPGALLGAAVTVLAFAGCGAGALLGTIWLGAGPGEQAGTSRTTASAGASAEVSVDVSRLTGTP
ncbi:hypothetical protein [Lentzea xinjiangensis]|uniref:hypothetical protein n=1 Tax=Lentzea xinjiangensis TaxID=402600 RepID=UPI001C435F80|nr:hypothetical protein [Lentzea xinjiangensis]